MRWYVKNFVGRYFYERTLFEADDQCQKHQLGLNYRSGWKKLGPLKSGTDRKFSDLPNGLPVVQLVQNGSSDGSCRSTGFASISFSHRDLNFGDLQLINVWTLACGVQDGFLNLLQQ